MPRATGRSYYYGPRSGWCRLSAFTDDLTRVLTRDLRAARRELEAFADERDIWRTAPGVSNCAGTLALHIAGNVQHFLGAVLGGTGYARDRDAEFGRRAVSRAELLAELDGAAAVVAPSLARLDDAALARPYPQPVAGKTVATGDFLLHVATHLAYHLGQMDYHRRLVTGQGATVGAMAPGELRSAT
jgi:uncharacterized damage-inducible protein DinB